MSKSVGVDVAGVAGEVGFLLEGAVLVREDAPLGDDRKEVGLAEFQGRVELVEPLVDVLSL